MDRRTIWAILLMMAIAIAPALLIKRPPKPAAPPAGQTAHADSGTAARPAPPQPDTSALRPADTTRAEIQAADTIRVTSPLYTYGISTVGGRLIEARLTGYRSMAPGDARAVAQILPPQSRFLAMSVVLGADTIALGDLHFTPSVDSLSVTGPASLRLNASKGQVSVTLTYTFRPDDYQIGVSGQVTGVGPNGGQLLVEMGPTLANTEANEQENHRALALVTKRNETERTDFAESQAGRAAHDQRPARLGGHQIEVLRHRGPGIRQRRRRDQRRDRDGTEDGGKAAHQRRPPSRTSAQAERGIRVHRVRRTDGV